MRIPILYAFHTFAPAWSPNLESEKNFLLRPVSIAALLVARPQRSTLRHARQENNEVRDDRVGVEPLSTSRHSARANESALKADLHSPISGDFL